MKWIAGFVAVGLLAGGFWYMQRDKVASVATDGEGNGETMMQEAGEEESFTGSLFDLARRGRDYECTFTQTTGDYETEGHVYIADGGKK